MMTRTREDRRQSQAGFTLIELMVVTVIIGILASIGLGYYKTYLLSANVRQAVPYLQNIAAKMRIHYNRTGRYLASGSEEEIQKKLGVDLSDAGDFCFMTFCEDGINSSSCGNYGSSPYTGATPGARSYGSLVSDGTNNITQFQVIAVLRSSTSGSITGAGSSCSPSTVAPIKRAPGGWVQSSGTGGAGSEGRVVVLSYPSPPDGMAASSHLHASGLDWQSGVSITDAVVP